MDIESSVERLTATLPILPTQRELGGSYTQLHRAILRRLLSEAQPLTVDMIADMIREHDLPLSAEDAVRTMGERDMIVLDQDAEHIVGAYPLTTESTHHHLVVEDVEVNAMCALDALSVGPMFDVTVSIDSICALTQEAIQLKMNRGVVESVNRPDLHVGVHWQQPCGHSAHSLCRDMVFLRDARIAEEWQAMNEGASIYCLEDAIAFGDTYFSPLMGVSR